MLYEIQNGSLSLGGNVILEHLDFQVKGKEKIAVVGRNGCGKTTLLRLIAGELDLDRDDKRFQPGIQIARDTSIEMLHQNPFTSKDITVEQLIFHLCADLSPFSEERFLFEQEYDRLFTGFGLKKEEKKKKLSEFSGGQLTKIALIHLLLKKPDILLLDEPTNHLDLPSIQWLETYLANYPGAVVLVSHDRYFLDQCVNVVYEIVHGKAIRYSGNYSDYKKQREKNRQIQEKNYAAQQKEIAHLNELIEKFKHKPTKASMARSKKKVLERMQRVEKPDQDGARLFTNAIEPNHPGSKWVLEALNLRIGYDKEHVLHEISLRVRKGQKIGILGENGTGKSTFLKTVYGMIPPLEGSSSLGNSIEPGFYDQHSSEIISEKRVFEHFSDTFPKMLIKDVKKTLGQYLFQGDASRKKISDLSGGEKSRLVLAELLESRPNLLLLDEPTNHMDIPAKETLESAFQMYKGTMLFVSHDRYFLKEIADALLIFEKDQVLYYPFGYDHYMEKLRRAEQFPDVDKEDLVQVENTLLINSFHDVPEKTRMQSARLNTEQSYTDWQMTLVQEKIEKVLPRLEYLWNQQDEDIFWENPGRKKEWTYAWETLNEEYTQLLLEWYDHYQEYEDAFKDYNDGV